MKRILGLDLGTNSIGWALVNEAENTNEKSSIVKLGVRTISYDNYVSTENGKESKDPVKDFCGGKGISSNAGRTTKRGMRRNLQRYKLRREFLIAVLKEHGFINDKTILSENGNRTTFETFRLRAKAATEEITLSELARVLLQINKKRGYKSSRKAKSTDEGQLIDGMEVAVQLYERGLTPGQYSYQLLKQGKKKLPDYYRSDLRSEFNTIWAEQSLYYPELLTEQLKTELEGKNKSQTWAICAKTWKECGQSIVGEKRTTKGFEQRKENYKWRSAACSEQVTLEQLAIVLQDINGELSNSSNYLGDISDRSKELYFNKQTVGQYQMAKLDKDPNYSLKNKPFYRQDYMDEFETIWETQSKYHQELTPELKKELRDIVIFYQRPLKSQKEQIALCEFENRNIEVEIKGKKKTITIGLRVCPKSSPLFQEFKIWHTLNNVTVSGKIIPIQQRDLFGNAESFKQGKRFLTQEEKEKLFEELNYKARLSKEDILKLLFSNHKELSLNFTELKGNDTQAELFKAYQTIIAESGLGEYDFTKMLSKDALIIIKQKFKDLSINTDILNFDSSLEGKEFEHQPMFLLWHLLYSFEGDDSKMGNEKLINKLHELYGFSQNAARVLANIAFPLDYGNLSSKAMRKILPYMKEGNEYSVACQYAGYRHSQNSLTKEEIENKTLKAKLDLLPRNSLHNPVVEKILNQMINVVNAIINQYGKLDEIHIELARELKKSAKERKEMTDNINATSKLHEEYREILQKEFGLSHVSRNDIIRYKLYRELEGNGYKTLYSNTYIPQEKLFSKEFDIEHIIPQAKLFDDSFSNKTIEARQVNIDKGNMTAYDFIESKYGEDGLESYKIRIEKLFKSKAISQAKRNKLLMSEANIPSDFINRDLRDSQYIAKKAREILETIVKVVVPTTGTITDRLREDWQLVDIMQELNWEKYAKLGMTEIIEGRDGQRIRRIKDWTKRNDHRHHAMDALTIAFTKRSFIQYLNNLNARIQKGVDDYIDLDMVELQDLNKEERASAIYGIEKKELHRDNHGKLRFNPPIPLDEFRVEAKRQLESTLISIKARNKVVTRNLNVSKKGNDTNQIIQLTPRGQLHQETIYGRIQRYNKKQEKINGSFNKDKIRTVANKYYRAALFARLQQYGGDAKKAFTGKNSLEKNPIWLNETHTKRVPECVTTFETIYTIRKEISPELKIDKVVDKHIKTILEERLRKYGNDAKTAFSNLEKNPIWLNEEKGIQIKRVTITGISNAIALHDKKDKDGNLILDKEGNKQPVDFVSTGNNHHVAVYRKPRLDKNGVQIEIDGIPQYDLDEQVVSFYEATARVMENLPIIDKAYKKSEGWQFLFTMKQNEFFVFPRYDENGNMVFNPKDYDEEWYKNPDNYATISPNLFRVQSISRVAYGNNVIRDYIFRHHLETTVTVKIKGITYQQFKSLSFIPHIVKVRINHIGQIVSIGEY